MKNNSRYILLAVLIFLTVLGPTLIFSLPSVFADPACGATVTTNTTLTANIGPCSGDGLILSSSAITLNCNGWSISGSGVGHGIFVSGATQVKVENCKVTGFQRGFELCGDQCGGVSTPACSSNTISFNTADSNSGSGFLFSSCSGNTIDNNTATGNTKAGFLLLDNAQNNIFTGNTANNNGVGFLTQFDNAGSPVATNTGNTFSMNTANNNNDAGFSDGSTGSGTSGTANYYSNNVCTGDGSPSSASALCQASSQSQLPQSGGVSTDWAIQSVSLIPSAPQTGDPVTFSAVLTALSTTGSYPQSVDVECMIDGVSCGGGSVSYLGPTGAPATVTAQTPWTATIGTHTLTWSVSTNNDPNPSNNGMSTTFTVGSVQTTQTVQTFQTIQTVQTTQTSQTSSSTQSAAPDFTINISPASQSVPQGQMASYSVDVVPLNGFNSQVSLSVSGLPSGVNGIFSNPSGTPNFASTLTVTLPGNVPTGSFTLTVTGSGGGVSHIANLVLTVSATRTAQTTISSSSTQTSSDLIGMIQQNPLLIVGGIVMIIALAVVGAIKSRRKPTQTQPTSNATPGMIYCRKCGTQNPTTSEFCGKCGTKLQ